MLVDVKDNVKSGINKTFLILMVLMVVEVAVVDNLQYTELDEWMDGGDRICFTKMHEIFLLLPKGGEERQRVLICFLFCVAYIFFALPLCNGHVKTNPNSSRQEEKEEKWR